MVIFNEGNFMNRYFYFLMVGMAFIALQVVTVEAQTGDPNMAPPMGDHSGMGYMPPMGNTSMQESIMTDLLV